MRAPVTHTIQGRRFEISPMGAFRGLKVMERLGKVLGPALGQVAASGKAAPEGRARGKGKATASDEVLEAAAAGFGALADRLDGTTLEWLARELAEDTLCQSPEGGMVQLKGVFDLYFAGEYGLMFAWAKAAFEVNFGPLGTALGGLGARLGASVAAAK